MGLFTSFQLKSRDSDTRRRAALKLGSPGKTGAVGALEPLLEDPEWPVREAATQALGVIADVAVTPLLAHAIRKADEVKDPDGAAAIRRAAVEAFARVGGPAVAPLLEALRDRHTRLREAAIEALGHIGGPESVEALLTALTDARSQVRQAAAPALARAGGREAVPALRAALSHKDPATRGAAAAALGAIREPAASEALRSALGDRERPVRDAVMQSLVAQSSPEAVGVLCGALLEGDRDLKAASAAALRSFDWSPADGRQRVVHAVLHGRYDEAAREGELAVGPLVAALADRDAATRRGAAAALGGFEDRRAMEALAGLLGDADAAVRESAIEALSRIGAPASSFLVRALDDRGGPARAAAARAIAAVGEGAVADAVAAPLRAGQPATHAGLPLRIVADREALDAARLAADHLAILVSQSVRQLPVDALRRLAVLDDVMLVETGRVPDLDERLSCEGLRRQAERELKTRGA